MNVFLWPSAPHALEWGIRVRRVKDPRKLYFNHAASAGNC